MAKAVKTKPRKTRRNTRRKTGVVVGSKIIAKPIYTPSEVAEILDVGRTTVTDMFNRGELPFEVIRKVEGPALVRRDGKQMRPVEFRRVTFDVLTTKYPWISKLLLNLEKSKGR